MRERSSAVCSERTRTPFDKGHEPDISPVGHFAPTFALAVDEVLHLMLDQ